MNQSKGQTQPYALKAGEGWTYQFGIDFTVKAGEVRRGSGAAVFEYATRKGEEPPDHTHRTEDEMLHLLEGAISFRYGESTFELEKGDFLFLPRGIKHGYTMPNDDPVRLLVVTAPVGEGSKGGWGGYVADLESGQGELIVKPGHSSEYL